MSSQPQEPALTFPTIWRRDRKPSGGLPEAAVVPSPTDNELMTRLQSGDPDGLGLLFDRYSRFVFGIALHILDDRGEAEEIVQEAFLCLYRKSTLFDPSKGTARTWIAQIAFNRALDRKSYLARRGFYCDTSIHSLSDAFVGKTEPERELETIFDRAQLVAAFQELPDVQRQTLSLFYFEGWELREISEKLNEPLGNVRHHFYRGLERLRKNAFLQKVREK